MNQEQEKLTLHNGGVSQEQIEKWKHQHRRVSVIEVVDGDEKHVGYFHRPTLETMAAVAKIGKTDEVKSAEAMFDNCFLGGSPHLRTDAILFMETTKRLGEMFSGCMSSLKNA